MRWGLGPVFAWEWSRTSRRWQTYALRCVVIALLLAALAFVWFARSSAKGELVRADLDRLGPKFFYFLVGTHLTLVLLAAPAATAGAICVDKGRGTLLHLLATDVSAAEIVLGKLAARMMPVLGLLLCSLPVLALSSLLGGLDPKAVLGAYLVTAGVAVLASTLALTLSVWGRKTHEVLLVNYLIWAGYLLFYPAAVVVDSWLLGASTWSKSYLVPTELLAVNPYWVAFRPYAEPGSSNTFDATLMLGACLVVSLALVGVAAAVLRRVVVGHREVIRPKSGPPSPSRFHLWRDVLGTLGPTLDANPLLWREWFRRRPSKWMALVWLAYALAATCFTCATAFGNPSSGLSPWVNGFQVAIGLLIVAVGAGSSLIEERSGGTLEVLMTTPVSTKAIVGAKWWSAARPVVLVVILPAGLAFVRALESNRLMGVPILVLLVLVHGAFVASLGLAAATWFRRPARALAVTVGVYVLIAGGLPLWAIARGLSDQVSVGIAMASPFFGAAWLTHVLPGGGWKESEFAWMGFWTGLYFSVSVALVTATVMTFDRCLGRIDPNEPPPRSPTLRVGSSSDQTRLGESGYDKRQLPN